MHIPLKAILAIALSAISASTLAAQQPVTMPNPNGWGFYDGSGPGTNPATIAASPSNDGNGALKFSIPAGVTNSQPSAIYLFGAPVSLSGLNSLTLSYDYLSPTASPVATSPTIRFLLDGMNNTVVPGRHDGSFAWYANGSSNSWMSQTLGLNSGNFFLRVGGVGQASNDCMSTGSSFDDRRQTISQFQTACAAAGAKVDLSNARLTGVQLDYGSFNSPGDNTASADNVCFQAGSNQGCYDFQATTTTPEPATYAMMGAGLFAIGYVRRRRNMTA